MPARLVCFITIGLATLPNLFASGAPPTFAERKAAYLEGLPADAQGDYCAVARLATGRPIDLATVQAALEQMDKRRDCADFRVAGLTRLMYLFGTSPQMPEDVRSRVKDGLLRFKYWIDEPGKDGMCYWSENHQALFHSAEYLVGNLYPDETFANSGMTGAQHREKGRRLIEQWLDWRERFGFSEWLSNDYFAMEIMALTNLIDFSPDAQVSQRAKAILDQLALDLALNSFKGCLTCTHGRTYAENVLTVSGDSVKQALYLLWGVRELTPDVKRANGAGIGLATSKYVLPETIEAIGQDTESTFENYQSFGLAPEEWAQQGFVSGDANTGMFLWGMETFTHPLAAPTSVAMWRKYNLWDNRFFRGISTIGSYLHSARLLVPLCRCIPTAAEGGYLFDAHTYTYRTPDYILSSVQDWRPGQMSAQVLSWEAGLGSDAVVFTTHPAKVAGGSPDYWTGNASNPRIAQYRNVLIAIYRQPWFPRLGETGRYRNTHAWFPEAAFDEVIARANWTFGRKDHAYIALFSMNPIERTTEGDFAKKEIIADDARNFWICEMGREADWGSLSKFADTIAASEVTGNIDNLRYVSPTLGAISFGWRAPFIVADQAIPLHRPMRYDNPFVHAARFDRRIEIRAVDKSDVLDFGATR